MNKQWIRLTGGVATVALLAVGCSMSPSMTHAMPGSMAGTATSATKAADLRTGLNALLGEHVYLASAATNAALGGRQAEFEAAAAALDANSVDIAKAIGSVFGAATSDSSWTTLSALPPRTSPSRARPSTT